jgi:polysaccharide export outer membrane protein
MLHLRHWIMTATLLLTVGVAGAADVLLGPGDVVRIAVYGSPDMGVETRVSEAGAITFPLLGQVTVGGLAVAAAERKIAGLLERGGYLKKPQVNMIITNLASQQVSVLGQVNRPGRYPIEGRRKVLDLLAMAGGIGTEGGDVVSLVRMRNGVAQRDTLDVVDMVRKGALDGDIDVTGGDVIYVERAPRAYIVGEVQRPGPFRLERAMTLQQALSAGGGLSPRGSLRGMRITRRDSTGATQTIAAKMDDQVQIDDVITVRESWF